MIRCLLLFIGVLWYALAGAQGGATDGTAAMISSLAQQAGSYTGMFTYSIPLYTIHYKNISIPISLNYATDGTRITDIPSWCGMGWHLSTGGSIVRDNVVTKDDNGNDYEYGALPFSLPGESGIALDVATSYEAVVPKQNLYYSQLGFNDPDAAYYFSDNSWSQISQHQIYSGPMIAGVSLAHVPRVLTDTIVGGNFSSGLSYIRSYSGLGSKIEYEYSDCYYHIPIPQNVQRFLSQKYGDAVAFQSIVDADEYGNFTFLKEIRFVGGKVRFVPTAKYRYDLGVHDGVALDKVVVEDDSGHTVKQYQLEYAYLYNTTMVPYDSISYVSNPTSNVADHNLRYRLMLTGITELDKNNIPLDKGTHFTYERSFSLSERMNIQYYNNQVYAYNEAGSLDVWGYFNRNYYNDANAKPNVFDPGAAKQGCLTGIAVPSGDSLVIYYEGNTWDSIGYSIDWSPYNNNYGGTVQTTYTKSAPGLRIAGIKHFHQISSGNYGSQSENAYFYSQGVNVSTPTYTKSKTPIQWTTSSGTVNDVLIQQIPTAKFTVLSTTHGGKVGYGKVQTRGDYYLPVGDLESRITTYTTPSAGGSAKVFGDWRNGLRTSDSSFGGTGRAYASTTNTINQEPLNNTLNDSIGYISNISSLTRIYARQGGYTTQQKSASFNDKTYALSSIVDTKGNPDYGNNIKNMTLYPRDYAYLKFYAHDISGNDNYDSMSLSNRPVEQLTLRKANGGNWYVTAATLQTYTVSYGDVDSVYIIDHLPLDLFTEFHQSNAQGGQFIPDPHYKLAVTNRWHLAGKEEGLCESINHITGDTTSYISELPYYYSGFLNGGSSTTGYPVVTAAGVGYDALMDYYNMLSGYGFDDKVAQLRTHFPEARISSTQYIPLVGVSVTSDPNGRKQYYEYDKANRLQYIRDEDGNILKSTEYHSYTAPIYQNALLSKKFQKNDCTVSAQLGDSVSYEVPVGKYQGATQAQADAMALVEIDSIGQAYANVNGGCGIPYAKLSYENVITTSGGTYGDVVVHFFADSTCTIPVSVNNVGIKYTYSTDCPSGTVPEEDTGNEDTPDPIGPNASGGDTLIVSGYSAVLSSGMLSVFYEDNCEWIYTPPECEDCPSGTENGPNAPGGTWNQECEVADCLYTYWLLDNGGTYNIIP